MYNENTEARSRNHCCSGKWISIAYSECVFVALGLQHAMRMCHIVICVLSDSTIFFRIISQMPQISKRKKNNNDEHKMCFDFLYDSG